MFILRAAAAVGLIAVYCSPRIFCSSWQAAVSKISSSSSPRVAGISGYIDPPAQPTEFPVVPVEDIGKLYQVAIERDKGLTEDDHLSLEFKSGRLRQYVTLTLARV